MSALPVPPVDAATLANRLLEMRAQTVQPQGPASVPFSQLLTGGVDGVNSKLLDAEKMVRAFTLDDSVPVHQVTYALSQARLSLELMTQMRNRLVEGYQQLMNMQL